MNHQRRRFLHLAAGAAALPALSRLARAQTYPSRPVRIIVGYPLAARPIVGELFKAMAGVNMIHVPYRGAAPALTDLISGQVQVTFTALSSSIEYIKAGNVRPLAVTTAMRAETLPGVPTLGEFVPGYEASAINGFGAPKNTPSDIIEKLNKDINLALANSRMKERLAEQGSMVVGGSPAAFGKLIADETEKWAKVIKSANIKPE